MSCNSLIGQWMNARHSWNYHQLSWPFERGLSLLDSNFHGLVVDIPPSISSMFENNSTAAPGWLQFILLSYFGKWVFNHLNNGYTMLFGPFGARPDIKANIPSCCRKMDVSRFQSCKLRNACDSLLNIRTPARFRGVSSFIHLGMFNNVL